jgi:hypothetical protein
MHGGNWWRVLLPWGAAAFLFKPRYRLLPEDAVLSRVGRVRAIAGLVMTITIAVYYGAFSNFGLEPLLQSLAATSLLAVPSMLVCMAIVVVATRSGRRGAAVRQLRWPALTLGVFVAIMGAVLLFNAGGAGRLAQYDDRVPLNGFIYGGIFSLWFLVFAFRGAYLVSQYWFNAVDGHPYLQPLMAAWMAWVLAINTLVFQTGSESGVPAAVATALPILAASLTTALAGVEAARVRGALLPAHAQR